jgi:hypothetical protein
MVKPPFEPELPLVKEGAALEDAADGGWTRGRIGSFLLLCGALLVFLAQALPWFSPAVGWPEYDSPARMWLLGVALFALAIARGAGMRAASVRWSPVALGAAVLVVAIAYVGRYLSLAAPHHAGLTIEQGAFVGVLGAILAIASAAFPADRDGQGISGWLFAGTILVWLVWVVWSVVLPTFVGCRCPIAPDKHAQSGLRSAIAAGKTLFTETDDYSGATATTLQSTEPSLQYTAGESSGPGVISFDVATTVTTNDTLDLAVLSKSGMCWYLEDVSSLGTHYGSAEADPGSRCMASDAWGVTGASW